MQIYGGKRVRAWCAQNDIATCAADLTVTDRCKSREANLGTHDTRQFELCLEPFFKNMFSFCSKHFWACGGHCCTDGSGRKQRPCCRWKRMFVSMWSWWWRSIQEMVLYTFDSSVYTLKRRLGYEVKPSGFVQSWMKLSKKWVMWPSQSGSRWKPNCVRHAQPSLPPHICLWSLVSGLIVYWLFPMAEQTRCFNSCSNHHFKEKWRANSV